MIECIINIWGTLFIGSVNHSISCCMWIVQGLTRYSTVRRLFHHDLMMSMWIHEFSSFSRYLPWATSAIFVHLLDNSLFVCLVLHCCRDCCIWWLLWFMILQRMLEIFVASYLIIEMSPSLSIWWSRSGSLSCLFASHRWRISRCSHFGFIIVDCSPISAAHLAQPHVIIL